MRSPATDCPAALFDHPCLRLLPRCTIPASFKQAHAQLLTTGLGLHTYPLSRLLFLFSSVNPALHSSYAIAVLRSSRRPTTFLYNILISAFSSAAPADAWSLYTELAAHPLLRPNCHTYPSLLRVCGPRTGLSLHAHVLKFLGEAQDRFVGAALVSFYSRCGSVSVCRHLFDRIPDPDLTTWNAILSAYSHPYNVADDFSHCEEALLLFNGMQLSLTTPNEITLVSMFSVCGALGAISQGMWLHTYAVQRQSIHHLLNHFVSTALISMYGKCGRLDLATQVFDTLPVKDTLCYNAMIHVLAVHGRGWHALKLFDDMRRDSIGVDEVTLLVVMSACAHSGLIDEGRWCFSEMKGLFGIEPNVEHYGCLVDLLGRAGCIKEAEEIVRKMPLRPNASVYRALLAACRIHNEFEIGEHAVRCLLQLEPSHGGNYVLLSNMYANMNRWEDVSRTRKMMRDQCINKDPGCSYLEIGGAMHEFVMGDRSHPYSRDIYAMLNEMRKRLRERGHMPSIKEVFFDVEEEDKEDTLSYHSERLAIALALVLSGPGTPIRIIKNLRVCGDCHSYTKLISEIYNREIIVRDRNRFHHFRYGMCSCLDYW